MEGDQVSRFELSEVEIACGVTMKDAANTREDSLVLRIPEGLRVTVPIDTPPALAGAAARMALGVPCEFAGLNHWGNPVYKPTE